MLRGQAAKISAFVVVAVLVALVPGAVRFFERDSAQRVETDDTPLTDQPIDEATAAALEAEPLVSGTGQLAEQSIGADLGPQLLDLTRGPDDVPNEGDGSTSTTEATGTTDTTEAGNTSSTEAGASEGDSDGAGDGDGDGASSTTGSTTTTAPTTTSAPPTTIRTTTTGTAPGTDQRALYVDPARGAGSNPGTEERPFRRPVEALSIAEPGTTIYLRGGTYDTSTHSGFSIRRSGTASQWIRITNYPGERVELVSGGEYGSGFEVLGASYIEVSGLVLRGRNDSIHGSGIFVKDGAHDVRIIGNQISNFGGAGISVIGSSKVHIEGNDVRGNAHRSFYQGSGISLFKMSGPTNSGHTNVIRGNYVVNNRNEVPHYEANRITDGNCIILDRNDEVGYGGWTLVENNVCAENGGRGVHSYRSSYIEARNNTLYHNLATNSIEHGRGEMTVGEARDVYFYNNLVINRPGIASYIDNRTTNTRFVNNHVVSGPPPGEGNQVLPDGVQLFSSTGRGGPVDQWRPLGGAGLAGTADGSKQAANDFFGRTRPSSGAVGAIEP